MNTSINSPDLLAGLLQQEELSPELRPFLYDSPLGQGLGHPLVESLIYTPDLNAYFNEGLRQKKQAIMEAKEQANWSRFIFLHNRPYRFNALDEIWSLIGREVKQAGLFISTWTDSESLYASRGVWEEMMGEISPGVWHHAMKSPARRAFDRLEFPLRVYRGGNPLYEQGLSWTIRRSKAEWFAHRFAKLKGEGEVYTHTVQDRDELLFYDGSRGEFEVVLHPDASPF